MAEVATLNKTLEGHKHAVSSVAFSSDCKLIASASDDYSVRLWNVPISDLNAELKGHINWVLSVAFSPDGQSIVTGSQDDTVRTWSVATKKQVKKLNGHSDTVNSVAWSPNGDVIASGSTDKTVILWDAISGSAIKTLTGHTNWVYSVSFSQNGNKLASAGYDKTVIIWDVNSGALIKLAHSSIVWSVCFSPDDRFVVTGCGDTIVRMFNANTGHEEKRFEGHTHPVLSVAISFDGSIIASGSSDKSIRLWDVASTKQLQQLDGHKDVVRSVTFSRDGKFIASGSWDKTVRLWSAPSSLQPQILPKPVSPEMNKSETETQQKQELEKQKKQEEEAKKAQVNLDPRQVAEWSVDDVCGYFKQAKIDDDVIAVFRKEKIDGAVLGDYASHDELKTLGIVASGSRSKVIKIIQPLFQQPSQAANKSSSLKLHEIPRTQLIKNKQLSDGNFGVVFSGTYNGIPVAIKRPKLVGANLDAKQQLADIVEEGTVMSSIPAHPNVVQCFGISRVNEQDIELVVEFCSLGSLDQFLKKNNSTPSERRLSLSQQTARGLDHLNKHNIVHRDVAARNVLVHEAHGLMIAKVADFGLSRVRGNGEYYLTTGKHLAAPETAPEVFITGKHSSRSDVWSFGVLLWEVESLCATHANPNKTAFPPLARPAQASNKTHDIMLKCWAIDPHQRPSFEELVDLLA